MVNLPHDIVVQTEDLALFEDFRHPSVSLYPTSEILPKAVERARLLARRRQRKAGRRGTKLLGSISRRIGWPRWPGYTGWHTQQVCKLAYVAASASTPIVVMDSDLVVTDHARLEDFLTPHGTVCFSRWQQRSSLTGKVRNWQIAAHRLFETAMADTESFDCYFDTPFVMHAPAVRNMQQWLEAHYSKPWWNILLSQPPRGWSEFCTYKTFLRNVTNQDVDWRSTDKFGYLFDAGEPKRLLRQFVQLANIEKRHYITIHSQSAGRQLWAAEPYVDLVRSYLFRNRERIQYGSRWD
ncbi:MAG: DUF6492 family protein [Woeseia sp.]